ncbi:hypothetical protein CKALI_09565 [Corynebacterium kalinowskii]|uniref:DUF2334 domain-containing protein n=2 Tax=Corynebacterium kalinowskii TaxID=2675216 RepID=A0A6B8W6C8_9CORY|nr:hypothetical protein CKALI_09565 [Corynebacterium kalinowskii]
MESTNMATSSKKAGILLAIIAVLSVIAAMTVVFFVLDDDAEPGLNSPVAKSFVDPLKGKDDLEPLYSSSVFDSTYGKDGGKHTLVLYDGASGDSEVLGMLAGNLATHFGKVSVLPIGDYQPGQIDQYDALIYQGYDYGQEIPAALRDDILKGDKKVLWANSNLEKLAGVDESPEEAAFIEKYGIDPHAFQHNSADKITAIEYKGQVLSRHEKSREMLLPAITDPAKVEVLGTALCGSKETPKACAGAPGESFPWAVRTGNITYVNDLPFEWQQEGSHYLAFADLYFDLLAPEAPRTQKAAVRIEDVSAMSNPDDLRRVADFLGSRNVPFQVAVIPFYVAETRDPKDDRHVGLELKDRPKVVEALKYMQSKGGTLIQHGTTHQYGAMQNPYPGAASAADYEFLRSRCSTQDSKPWVFEECKQESWVQLTGPLINDEVSDHADRIERGRQAFVAAGLGEPDIFETPHYGATPNAYEAMAQNYEYRYEQTDYYSGLITGKNQDFFTSLTQILPYSVSDVYGGTVLPENIGNPSVQMLNNHAARPPSLLVGNAEKNSVVREATASFFFHPFLDIKILEEIVDGIEGLGYEFVPAKEL